MEEETKFTVSDKRPQFSESEAAKVEPSETASIPVTFSSFVLSLATSALINLGLENNPETGTKSVELSMAKQIIDLLSLLQEKTKGNLTVEEEGHLTQTLFALRMKFVELGKNRSA